MANQDILAFQGAANTYNDIAQVQNQRLQMMAQEDARARQMQLQEEQAEQQKREQDRLRYAEWEKQQILNSATSRLQSMMKNEDTGATYQGKKLYREPSLQDMMIGQNKLAAEEAQKRGRGDLAMSFMAEAEKVSAMKAKMEQEKRKAILEEKELTQKIEGARDKGDRYKLIQVKGTNGQVHLVDENTGETIRTINGEKDTTALDEAQSNLSDSITTLRGYYDHLDELGAIVNPKRGTISNISASIGASGIGQVAGGIVGSDAQTIRDSINMQRPLLLQAIKSATGMSSKQMDSNAELKLWLSSATDPTLSIDANKAALDSIERKYLKKDGAKDDTGTPKPQDPSKQVAPKAAIDYLMTHPETKEQFKAKFGYLPEGI